ncbi:MAG: hypothetical protein DRN35_01885 [Thermoplasmata archaeon]|nr:MAG: hypothetical protein DRN28_02105 [Thermoplasmata archaeon]RLF70210.1 MAG: hypothetical protein DRN40_05125 [Thermoplasmata archaeon]RLF71744.1 MAG: hypothetical protein DRN35_01885 [Thermoplasmata archaeon]RLF73362.1 MAG: hypothetical protein DRN55_03800 [Thermoplasmata archaeon]HDD59667.1 hypothetical protein [Euryarchaeota archaeon]
MVRKAVYTPEAPHPVGAYSQAIVAGDLLTISGQIPVDPATGRLSEGGPGEQTELIMRNIGAILSSVDLDYSDLVKVRIYTTGLKHFKEINEVYSRFFDKEPPARVFVEVSALPLGALVEIEAEAYLGK